MKIFSNIEIMTLLILFFLFPIYSGETRSSSDLIIEIKGIETVEGKIQIGIYNDEDKFPEVGGAYRSEYFTVTAKEMSCTIKDLPNGVYAIALFHDVNSDGECNLNFWGFLLNYMASLTT